MSTSPGRKTLPVGVVLRIAAIVFAVEGMIMLALAALVPAFMGFHSEWALAAFDAAVLVAISSPLIYSWVIRPYVLARSRAEAQLRGSECALQERVIELEQTRCELEQQGAKLARLAADLGTARDQADAASQAKSEFLANMSHELRTPLNAIMGFSEMIRDQVFGPISSPKYLEYAKDINQSGEHLLALINDILDLSKIEAGKLEFHGEAIDVSKAVGHCLHMVKEHAETTGVNLISEIADDLPPLYADERKLKQVLINLLSNAVKFTRAGGKVTIKTWSRPDGGYVFQVADTGIGIALEDIAKALAPFQQIDSDLNREYEGTGLGLPLTKSLVELHGGSLDLQSEVGVGTTVTVRLPAEHIVSEKATGTELLLAQTPQALG